MEKRSQFDVMNPHGDKQVLKEPGAVPNVNPYHPELPLSPHVQRMAAETQTVVTNLRKLDAFISEPGSPFHTLLHLEKQLLTQQRSEMVEYAKTLSLRYCMALLAHG